MPDITADCPMAHMADAATIQKMSRKTTLNGALTHSVPILDISLKNLHVV